MNIVILLIFLCISTHPISSFAAGILIPQEVLVKIDAKATADFPNDQAKQEDVINTQIAAYNKIKHYNNKKISAKLLEKIKTIAEQDFPHDFESQLAKTNQLVNAYIKLGRLSTNTFTTGVELCKKLSRRIAKKSSREFYYWGTVKPGSADVVYLVVRSNLGMIGQNISFPNSDGSWEITIWGDYHAGNTRREKFYCEKY